MKSRLRLPSRRRAVGVCGCLCVLAASFAGAQQQGPQYDAAKIEKAWEGQARFVAGQLGLAEDQTSQLVDTYTSARQSYNEAARSRSGEGGQPDWRARAEQAREARGKLEESLKGFLNDDQASQAVASLGTFNRRWDVMVVTLQDMNLDEEKMKQAMAAATNYIVEVDKLMSSTAPDRRREAFAQSRELREKLDEEMGKVLTPEQMKTWSDATALRRGPGRGPRPADAPSSGSSSNT